MQKTSTGGSLSYSTIRSPRSKLQPSPLFWRLPLVSYLHSCEHHLTVGYVASPSLISRSSAVFRLLCCFTLFILLHRSYFPISIGNGSTLSPALLSGLPCMAVQSLLKFSDRASKHSTKDSERRPL